ncbi:MAG: calcium-binding protein [Sulfuricurvum sp.]|nr:calcium-binding protein [Sulfuricurvum sp.]
MAATKQTLTGDITTNMTLTKDKVWVLDGLVAVKNGATLTIEAGTIIVGKDGTGSATSYMIIDKGSKIDAQGTALAPIVFTSEKAYDGAADAVGQWGGLTIIGNAGNAQVNAYEVNTAFVAGTSNMADNSGILKYVKILNSGITMQQDKEINGLSLVGVGSGTTIDNITVNNSDDDGIELWGGTVNLSNITISGCTDDHFDIDDGYSGTVTNLTIVQTSGNAAIEMSGTTNATFDGLTITQNKSNKEGVIFFKGAGIGGTFKNATITDNVAGTAGAIHSDNAGTDTAHASFTNVTLNGTSTDAQFTGPSAIALKTKFDGGSVQFNGSITSDDDVLTGTSGIDTLSYETSGKAVKFSLALQTAQKTGGSGTDTVSGFENVTGSAYNDKLTGDSSDNVIDGGVGADNMAGGLGDDTYYIDNSKDKATEAKEAGNDTVHTSINITKAINNIENFIADGTSGITIVGNTLNNIITGNSGANVLDGGLGNDTLIGGNGADTFKFSTKLAFTNYDIISTFTSGEDKIELSKKIFKSIAKTFTADNFINGTAAVEATDYLIYNKTTGILYYDADGIGTKSTAIEVAIIGNNTDLAFTDFTVA